MKQSIWYIIQNKRNIHCIYNNIKNNNNEND